MSSNFTPYVIHVATIKKNEEWIEDLILIRLLYRWIEYGLYLAWYSWNDLFDKGQAKKKICVFTVTRPSLFLGHLSKLR